jgi:hypothetical protein
VGPTPSRFWESKEAISSNHAYPMRAARFAVRECTDDSSRITPTRKQMEEIARMIPLEGRRKSAGYGAGRGFVAPSKRTKKRSCPFCSKFVGAIGAR